MDAFDGLSEFMVEGKTFRLLADTYAPGCQYIDPSGYCVTVWQESTLDGPIPGQYSYNSYSGDPNDLSSNLFMQGGFTDYRACAVAGLRAVGL